MAHTVITVGREYGSGGRLIAQQAPEALGIPFFDRSKMCIRDRLQKVALTQLSDRYAMAGNQKYLLDENVQVLLQGSGGCYATTLSAINAEDYSLRGWYDALGCPGGGRIRILVATVA